MIKSIPAVWDETRVLPDSEIGKLAVFARRTGDTWFLAGMCGPEGRTLRAPLTFLGEGEFAATLVRDDKDNSDAVTLEEKTVQRGDALTVEMIDGGGFVARFSAR